MDHFFARKAKTAPQGDSKTSHAVQPGAAW
jgi:hypothetical protein